MILLSDLHIPPWLRKDFRFMVFRLLENAFASQNIESSHSHPCPLSGKTLLQVLLITTGFNSNSIHHTPLNVNYLKWSIPTNLLLSRYSCAKQCFL